MDQSADKPAQEPTGAGVPEDPKQDQAQGTAPAPAAKPEDTKPEEGTPSRGMLDEEPEKEPAKEPEKKPEDTELQLKPEDLVVPEGMQVKERDMTGLLETAKDLKLGKDGAQKLLNFGAKIRQAWEADAVEAVKAQLAAYYTQSEAALKADPEFGGDRFQETRTRAQRALRTHGSEELRRELQQTGLIGSAHLVRMLAKIDKATGEDRAVGSQGQGATEREMSLEAMADRAFPDSVVIK